MFKNGSEFDGIFDPVVFWEFLDDGRHLEWQIYVLRNTISHDFKEAIWRNKCNASVTIELAETHTLMKLDIVNLDALLLLLTVGSFRIL